MTEPFDSQVPKDDPWRQLAIVFVCSLVLTITCCGGGFALSSHSSKFLSALGNLFLILGCIFLLVFVVTIVSALVRVLLALVSGFRQ
jgi:hypothetical protein